MSTTRTLDDEILSVQRMARCSRYWARAARLVAAEFRPELEEELARARSSDTPRSDAQSARLVDLRSMSLDKESEARRHDAEAEQLEAVVRRLEEMRTVLQSFRISAPDGDRDVWLHIDDQGDSRQAAFNLGKPVNESQPEDSPARIKISHHVAALREQALRKLTPEEREALGL